jgi:5-methylcytosine-specific restriction enzyme A
MPSRPLRPCGQVGCPKLVVSGRCDLHKLPPRQEKAIARPYDDRRESSTKRGYGYAWQQRRKAGLIREPKCAVCGKPGTDRDHIISKSKGGADLDYNIQTLCSGCHKSKTARERGM